jgi:hypothetical protein
MIVVLQRQRVHTRIYSERLTYSYSLTTCANTFIIVKHLIIINGKIFFDVVIKIVLVVIAIPV